MTDKERNDYFYVQRKNLMTTRICITRIRIIWNGRIGKESCWINYLWIKRKIKKL